MGAYWHVLLPVKAKYDDKPSLSETFDKLYQEDFVFDNTDEYQIQSPPLPDGKRLTFERRERYYHLDSGLLKREFPAFYLDFIATFHEYAVAHDYRIYSPALTSEYIEPFLEKFKATVFQDSVDAYMDTLEEIEENYFLHYYDLPSMVVYHGYPLPQTHHSSFHVISLLSSHEKMNVIPEETVAFHNLIGYVREKLQDRYKLAKYLFVAGF